MNDELKCCAHCGAPGEWKSTMFGRVWVECSACGLRTKKQSFKALAIVKWNDRVFENEIKEKPKKRRKIGFKQND